MEPKRELNFYQTTAIIIGAVIGAGVFMNIPLVARQGGTPLMALIIWLLGGLVWIPQIGILAEMGTAYPNQGGPYYFIYKAGSPFLAFIYTWTAFLTSDTPTITIISLMAAAAAAYFYPVFNDPIMAKIFAAVLIFVLAAIQIRNVKTGGTIQVVLTLAKVLPLIAIVIIGFMFIGSGNFSGLSASNQHGSGNLFSMLTSGVSTTIWAYAGFLNILYMAGEVKSPDKILPRSLIFSLIFVIAAYTLISFSVSLIVPFNSVTSTASGQYINPFSYIPAFSGSAGALFSILFFISMLGVLNSVIMTQPRLEYAMANDKLFFQVFGKLHPKYLTPHFSIWIQAGLAVILFFLKDIDTMLGYFTLSYVLQNALVYGAIFKLRHREDYKPAYRVKFWKSAGAASVAIQLCLAYGAVEAYPQAGIAACAGLMITGLPIYFFFNRVNASKPS